MSHQELIPQQARPSPEADEDGTRQHCVDKLNRLVVNLIVAQQGHRDTLSQQHRNNHRYYRDQTGHSTHEWWGRLCKQWREKQIQRSTVEWAAQGDMSEEEAREAVERHGQVLGIDLAVGESQTFIIDEMGPVNWDRIADQIEGLAEPGEGIRWIPVEEIKAAFRWFVGRWPTGEEFYELVGMWKRNELELEDFKLRTDKFKDNCPIDYGHQVLVSRNNRVRPKPGIAGLQNLGTHQEVLDEEVTV